MPIIGETSEGKRQAVLKSHALIAKTLDTQPAELRLTLENYDEFLK